MVANPRMVYADASGEVFDHPRLKLAVFDGYCIRPPKPEELVPLPHGSDTFLLPGRLPLGFSGKKNHLVELEGEVTAVSAFLAPAYLRLTHPAYRTMPGGALLPLFAYAPVGWADGVFWTTAVRIDPERRQDPGLFNDKRIAEGVRRDLRKAPSNRLLLQLRRCALDYQCRAAQNFFLKRWECPLPTTRACNARCVGCISLQEGEIPATQDRLQVEPSAEEVAEVACLHFGRTRHPVASFGQGCEGEPLCRASTLKEAVTRIRKSYPDHTVNLNSNASMPDAVAELFDQGLSSLRVTLASPTEELYNGYHRPRGYTLDDVCTSVRRAKERGGFVSLNLLVFPGLTDRESEVGRLMEFIDEHQVDMVQWRNMNIDPEYYLDQAGRGESGIGLLELVSRTRAEFGHLRHGYFNPCLSGGES